MYKPQRGCLPYFISTIGALFFIGLIAGNLILNIESWFSIRLSMPLNQILKYIISNLAVSLIIIIIFLPFPLFLAEMFPAVRVSKEGVKYRFMGVLGGLIRYNEIEEIADLKRPANYKALVISRKGFALFNGLWMFLMYGMLFTGQVVPVIVLSPGTQDREKFLDEIKKNLS